MLCPSVCRLTLALLVFCLGRSSPIFPCTSLEIGIKSVASVERSSKSPSSLFWAPLLLLLENGHSPDIFSSFSFVQNIFPAVWSAVSALLISSRRETVLVEQLRSLREIPSSGVRAHPIYLPPRDALIQMISTKARDHIQYSLRTARANDGRELSLPKANEKLEKKEH